MVKKASLLIGIAVLLVSLGVFAWVTDAPAYLSHEPSTCNNCHVMDAQYENWAHAAHTSYAVCTDCHLPHQNLASYYLYKGYSGMKDVLSFTFKTYPAALRATAQTDRIVEANCIRCHDATVDNIVYGPGTEGYARPAAAVSSQDRPCWDCHRSVAHGERGLSLYPYQDSEVYVK